MIVVNDKTSEMVVNLNMVWGLYQYIIGGFNAKSLWIIKIKHI